MKEKAIIMKPLYLVPNKNVKVEWDEKIDAPALVQKNSANSFTIKINKKLALSMFASSILFGKIPSDWFLAGLMYHEVAHILYDSLTVTVKERTQLFEYISNVLLDAQIEYQISKDFPEAAKYIRYVLIGLRRDCDMHTLEKIKGGQEIIKLKDTFFYLSRFGVVLKDSDKMFVDFFVPLLLSAERNKVQNVYDAAQAVYEYMFATADSEDLRERMTKVVATRGQTQQSDLKALDEAGDQLVASGLKEAIEEMQNQGNQDAQKGDKANGTHAGHDGPQIELEEQDDAFYRSVVTKHKEKIIHIRNAIKRKMNQIIEVPAFEGELAVQYQQQAYVDSFTGDENEIYFVPMLAAHSIDHLLIRDISGSTGSFSTEYAEASVILHAALQDMMLIRDAHIDFSDNGVVLLDFDKPLRSARIHPRVEGGTVINDSYEKALKMDWKGVSKLINVITDGDIYGGYQDLEAKLKDKGIKIQKWHVGDSRYHNEDSDVKITSISRFHYDVADYILKEL